MDEKKKKKMARPCDQFEWDAKDLAIKLAEGQGAELKPSCKWCAKLAYCLKVMPLEGGKEKTTLSFNWEEKFLGDIKHDLEIVLLDRVRKDPPVVKATVSLKGTCAWKKSWDQETGDSFHEEVPSMEFTVSYIPPEEVDDRTRFFGWKVSLGDTVEVLNRQLGCLAAKLPAEVAPFAGPNSDWKRVSCGETTRTFKVPANQVKLVTEALAKVPGFILINEGVSRTGVYLQYRQEACPMAEACDRVDKIIHHARVHIPYPGQAPEEASTALVRNVAGCVGAVVAKLLDPTFPDLNGVYARRGLAPRFPMQQELYPSCRTCLHYRYVRRDNLDGDMRQSSLITVKTDGIDPVDWCSFRENWIPQMSEQRVELNQKLVPAGSGLGQALIANAAKASACAAYTWNTRFRINPGDLHRQQAVWNNWVPALRSVDFVDGKEPKIVASAPAIKVSFRLPEELARYQRNFR